ncbi:uncharacterized mitochondrial protein-like protein [Tanacetum coccineum]
MNNLDTTIQVSHNPTIRIHKDHPLDQVIGDLQSATQTRKMSKNLEEHGFEELKKGNSCIEGSKLDRGYVGRDSTIQVTRSLEFKLKQLGYLYGKIEEEVYVCQPPGFEDPDFPDRVYKISSMGELTFFLGLQVQQKKDDIFISQDKYVVEILKKFGFTEVKTTSTLMETQKPLLKDEDGEEVDVHMYRYQVNPKVSHLHAVKRIFRYLKGQPKLGLWYPKDSPFDLVAYTDSDYAGASLDRKSTTGGCQFLGCRLISWQCKKQTVVANSTTEAEYVAASSCCGQLYLILLGKAKKSVKLMMEKQLRMELEVPQPSDLSENVADEAVHKKLGDSLVRAATNASSLEVEQDSGGGPVAKKTMGVIMPRTRVLDLEKTKTSKHMRLLSLKRRVKKLEKKNSLGEDASKQGRINAIDADEKITIVSVQDDADKEMFDVDAFNGEEVFVAGQNENVVEEVVDAAQVM